MEHVTEIQLIEYVAGNLPRETASNLESHIKQCSQCANTLGKITQTWQTTSQWQPDIDAPDTPQQFVENILAQDKKHRIDSIRTKIIQMSFRYAASILIAVTLGVMLGKQSVSPDTVYSFGQNAPEYLASLSMQWSSDLTWTILEHDQPRQGDQD
jgi:anti-sigma factor RsiW